MISPLDWDVYLVTDRMLSKGRSTRSIVESAIRGGASVVQLREKSLDTREFYRQGMEIRELLKDSGIPLIVNDRIDVALAIDADGVHLGQKDMPVSVARRILGPDRIIGLSVEREEDINREAESCADYLAVSPVFATPTKTDTSEPWGLSGLAGVRSMTALPLVAIGSLNIGNAREVIIAGADSVAVVSAIVSADDPAAATRELTSAVREAKAIRNRQDK